MSNLLDHMMAQHADDLLEDAFSMAGKDPDAAENKNVKKQIDDNRKRLKKYRSAVMSAVAQLRQVGLLQLAIFWVSKGGEQEEALKHCASWLNTSPRTRALCAATDEPPARPAIGPDVHRVTHALLQRTSQEIALLEDELEAYLSLLRRLVEGRWKEIKGADGEEDADEENGESKHAED